MKLLGRKRISQSKSSWIVYLQNLCLNCKDIIFVSRKWFADSLLHSLLAADYQDSMYRHRLSRKCILIYLLQCNSVHGTFAYEYTTNVWPKHSFGGRSKRIEIEYTTASEIITANGRIYNNMKDDDWPPAFP